MKYERNSSPQLCYLVAPSVCTPTDLATCRPESRRENELPIKSPASGEHTRGESWLLRGDDEDRVFIELGKAIRLLGYDAVSEWVMECAPAPLLRWQVSGAGTTLTISQVASNTLSISGNAADIDRLKRLLTPS